MADFLFRILDCADASSPRYQRFIDTHHRIILFGFFIVIGVATVLAVMEFQGYLDDAQTPSWAKVIRGIAAGLLSWFLISAIPSWLRAREQRSDDARAAILEQQRKIERRAARLSKRGVRR